MAVEQGLAVLKRGLKVLRAFTELKPEWGVRELATEMQMPTTVVYRILRTFAMEGFLRYDKSRRNYRLGLELYRIGAIVHQNSPLTSIALPIMRELAQWSDETVLLGLYDPERVAMSFVAQVESDNPIRYVIKLGGLGHIHSGASGRAILAYLEPKVIDSVLSGPLEKVTDRTLTNPDEIRQVLKTIRKTGYAFSRGERIVGAFGVAAPVWDLNSVIGSLCATMPESRYKSGVEKIVGPKVQVAASRLSIAIGGKRNSSFGIARQGFAEGSTESRVLRH
jgi:DNA-binding IclR family transcriptional regulator